MRRPFSAVPKVSRGACVRPLSLKSHDYNFAQVALKERGVDKLLDEAREDNKENDARLAAPRS